MTQAHVFGIRHHGPGCARSLVLALQSLQPDCLLLEGPPDAESALPFVLDAEMQPPAALLVHCPDDLRHAVFYPFAEFSPEWQALRYGLAAGIPTRFIDLPCAVRFALAQQAAAETGETAETGESAETADTGETAESGATSETAKTDETGETIETSETDDATPRYNGDPLNWLAEAAGYGDGETWWNHQVEERGDGEGLFAAIAEAMRAVRAECPEPAGRDRQLEDLREAHMRRGIRQAQKEGFERIAVVCGAWHVPALEDMPPVKDDNALLKSLPKLKVAATWVAWSNGYLSRASGYGAGIVSPGWYEHLWRHPQNRAITWLTKIAALLRDEDLDCSSAHLIEAARLAETLAVLRGRPAAGLDELNEATLTVILNGEDSPLRLIERRLIVGERLGKVPSSVPTLPLQRDLEREQTRLRLKPEALDKTLDLDLRQTNDLARSHLLHRLNLLDIGWGERRTQGYGAKGTFHEIWRLQWRPELSLAVIDAARFGNTVEQAASNKAIAAAADSDNLAALSKLVDVVLLADLQQAVNAVVQALENRAAISGDTVQMLEAIPPLANIVRYGNVRNTDAGLVRHVLDGMVIRAAIGLNGACASLDDAAAEAMLPRIAAAHRAITLIGDDTQRQAWLQALAGLAQMGGGHGLVCGLAARLRFDEQADELDTTAHYMSRALSVGNEPLPAAAWLEGFLHQSGMVLLHDDRLWGLVDQWLADLSEEHFTQILPLVRRTFSTFHAPERRQLAEKAKNANSAKPAAAAAADWDEERAGRPLPLLRQILGLPLTISATPPSPSGRGARGEGEGVSA